MDAGSGAVDTQPVPRVTLVLRQVQLLALGSHPARARQTLPTQPQPRLRDVHVLQGFRGADLCPHWENFAPRGCGCPFRQPVWKGIPSLSAPSGHCVSALDAEVLRSLFWGKNQRGPFKAQMN